MTAVLGWANWLQIKHGAYVFAVDHPGLPQCAGAHKPSQPCDGKRGKHPCGHWPTDSTTDPAVIAAALARGLRNTGVDTLKSGLLVVDEDQPRAFTDYAASISATIPDTFTVTTAKGRHFYFRQPAGDPLGNGTGVLPEGIDVRGRGYVVAPGSVHETGVRYLPADPASPIVPIPEWLVSALRPAVPAFREPAGAAAHSHVRGSLPGRLRGVLAVVLDARPPGPGGNPPGNRNERLFWAGCRVAEMVAAGELDQAAAVRVLTEAGEVTGLGSGAVAATISSAMNGRCQA